MSGPRGTTITKIRHDTTYYVINAILVTTSKYMTVVYSEFNAIRWLQSIGQAGTPEAHTAEAGVSTFRNQ